MGDTSRTAVSELSQRESRGTVLLVGARESESARDRQLIRSLSLVGYSPVAVSIPGIKRGRGFLRLIAVIAWPLALVLLLWPRRNVRALIVAHDNHMFAPPARLASAIRRVPLLVDAFDPLTVMTKYDWGGGWRLWFLKRLEQMAFKLSSAALAVTRLQARQIALFYKARRPVYVVTGSGADPGMWEGAVANSTRSDVPRVVFWGRFHPSHGTEVIMEAARLLKDEPIRFEMFGSGVKWQEASEFASVNNLSNVTLHGMAPLAELRVAAASCTVALGVFSSLPPVMTTIPWKLGEALSLGRPLITGATPASRLYLKHGESAYLVPPRSAEQLAKAITALVSDPELQSRLSTGAQSVYEQNFSDASVGEALHEAIVMAGRR